MHKAPIVAVESWGVLVDLGSGGGDAANSSSSSSGSSGSVTNGGTKALVTTIHLADAAVTDVKKRFRVGAKVNCRILTVERGGKRVHATMKKSLVTDAAPPILSYEELLLPVEKSPLSSSSSKTKQKKNNDGDESYSSNASLRSATGFVTRITAGGLVVTFFNNVHGLVGSRTLLEQGVDDIHEVFAVGQVVKCRILRCILPEPAAAAGRRRRRRRRASRPAAAPAKRRRRSRASRSPWTCPGAFP